MNVENPLLKNFIIIAENQIEFRQLLFGLKQNEKYSMSSSWNIHGDESNREGNLFEIQY